MSGFEYTVEPPGQDDGRRWAWGGEPVAFDTSNGGDIKCWSEEIAAVRGPARWR